MDVNAVPTNRRFTLLFQTAVVGTIENAFQSDATWYGTFRLAISPADGRVAERVLEFVSFVKNWNERVRANSADVAEFDQFSDVVSTGLWSTIPDDGSAIGIVDAPIFFEGDDISWRPLQAVSR